MIHVVINRFVLMFHIHSANRRWREGEREEYLSLITPLIITSLPHSLQGTLDVSKLYPSDSFLVCSDGCTLVMMAAMNNRTEVLKELVKMDNCPLDFKQMKVGRPHPPTATPTPLQKISFKRKHLAVNEVTCTYTGTLAVVHY